MKQVREVSVKLWGCHVGVLRNSMKHQGCCLFEFDKRFTDLGVEISPLSMPYRRDPYVFEDLKGFRGLPPVFADSLSDGLQTIVLRRNFRNQLNGLDALERLSIV